MTASLKNRQVQIPGGLQFRIPEVGFIAPPYQSFDTLVASVLRVVLANPKLAAKFRWPTDRAGVEVWVDHTNAMVCQQNGWKDYITVFRDLEPPKLPPPSGAHPLEALAAGAKSLAEWFGAGGEPVEKELALSRAKVCFNCPQNHPGDWGNWFSRSASELIRKVCSLGTEYDEELGVCEACQCPTKLKVHVPIPHILNNIPADSKAALDSKCWILSEEKMSATADII